MPCVLLVSFWVLECPSGSSTPNATCKVLMHHHGFLQVGNHVCPRRQKHGAQASGFDFGVNPERSRCNYESLETPSWFPLGKPTCSVSFWVLECPSDVLLGLQSRTPIQSICNALMHHHGFLHVSNHVCPRRPKHGAQASGFDFGGESRAIQMR